MRYISIVIVALVVLSGVQQVDQTRLLVIGDSLSKGLYATSEVNAYRYLVADATRARLGWMLAPTLEVAEEEWADWRWPADVIIVELGSNDLWIGIPEEEWAERYGAFLDDLQATGARVIVGTITWSGRVEGSESWRRATRYNEYIRAEAGKRGITVVDLWAVTMGHEEYLSRPDELSPFEPGFEGDGFHPGDLGHRAIAEAFVGEIRCYRSFWPVFRFVGGE